METNFETNIPQPPKKGNRLLVYTLGFLFLFSIGTYAFGAALYHPGDSNDPSCAPGDAGCFVSVFPDDTGHGGEFLTTDGSGNASWAAASGGGAETLQDVLNNGAMTDGSAPIKGKNFLQFDAPLSTENGILNHNGDAILSDDTNDNVLLTGYNASHALNGMIGFDSSGNVQLAGTNVIGHVPLSASIDAYSKIGSLSVSDLAASMTGSFSYLDDRTASRQDVVGVSVSGFGTYGDAALLAHADSSQNYAASIAYDSSGTPTYTTLAHKGGSTLTTQSTPTEYQVTGIGKVFDVNVGTNSYGLGDLANKNNSTYLSINDGSSVANVNGYINTTTAPTVSAVTFSGTGLNNLTPSGTFTGSSSATFVVRIDQVNKGAPQYSSKTGTFTAGETVTVTSGAGTGSTATYVSDTGAAPGTFTFTNEAVVSGGIAATSVITGNSSGATVTISSFGGGLFDMFTWTSTDGAVGGPNIATSVAVGDSISVAFATQVGHHLGDTWTFGYVYPTGKMLSLNGRAGTFTIGDVDSIKHGTKLVVDDSARTVSITGSGGTCSFDGSASGGTCFSDERLKTNIADLPDELAQINQLRPVTYTWIDPKMPQTQNVGLIAQEVQKVFPNLVGQVGDTGYLGVQYDGLIVPAVKAIQELDMKVEPLTSIDPTVNGSLASLIVQFLQNAVVSIKEATIGTLHIGDQVCADDVCVTKEQFKNLLLQAGGTSSTPPPVVTPTDPVTPPSDPVVTPPNDSTATSTPPDSGTTPPVTDPVVVPADSTSISTPPVAPSVAPLTDSSTPPATPSSTS